MDWITLIRIIRRWGWLALIPPAIALAITVLPALRGGSLAIPPTYSMSITYSAAQQFEAIPRTEGDYQDIWLSSELTVNAFTEWIRGSLFRQEIAAAAAARGVTVEPGQIGIAADNARSVGRIDLSYPTSDGMEAVGAAVIEVLSTRSADYFAQLGGQPAEVTILSQSPITAVPPPIGDRVTPILRVGIGLIAGLVLMVAAYFLDPMLRSRAELNEAGVRVLGTIPRR